MMSWLLKIAAGIVAFVIVLVLTVMFVNWKDEPPSESALKLRQIAESAKRVADQDNAYVYAMGFSAPDEADAEVAGIEYVDWLRKFIATSEAYAVPEFPGAKRTSVEERDPELRNFAELCKANNRACGEAVEQDPARIQSWVQRSAKQIDRYEKLLEFKEWRELWPSDFRTQVFLSDQIFEAQRLMLLKAWLLANQGDEGSCKRLLEKDLKFWRMTLAESSSLIDKMAAASAIERHFAMGNLVLRRFSSAQMMKAVPDGWRQPLSASERSVAKVMASEWEFADKAYHFAAVVKAAEPSRVVSLALEKIASLDDSQSEVYAQQKFGQMMFLMPLLGEIHRESAFSIAETVKGGYKKTLKGRLRKHFAGSEGFCKFLYPPIFY